MFIMQKSISNHAPSGILIHNYKIKVKGIKKKILYHFSDLHLTEYDSFSDEREKLEAIHATHHWENLRLDFAKHHNEPHSKEQQQSTHNHLSDLLAEAEKGDALIMAGDICDYINGANVRTVNYALNQLTIPFIYVCGNHENIEKTPGVEMISNIKKPVQTLDLGDIVILGIDNSTHEITAEQNAQLKEALLLGKPLIIAMHIPILSEGNKDLEDVEDYFHLNRKAATKEVFAFMDFIKEIADKIVAVLAGHLHFMNNSEIAPGVTQYVSSQGLLGNINRYEIGI